MLCEKCHSRQACVHIRAFGPDGQSDHNLCLQCAMTSMTDQAEIARFLQILEENSRETGVKLPVSLDELRRLAKIAKPAEEKRCPKCGRGLSQVINQQRLGCRECLNAFREELREFLQGPLSAQRQHKSASTGLPSGREPSYDQERLSELREELIKCVKAEHYERAAELKKQVHALEELIATSAQADNAPCLSSYANLCREILSGEAGDRLEVPVWAPRLLEESTIRLSSVVQYCRNVADYAMPPFQGASPTEAADVAGRLLKILRSDPLFADALLFEPGKHRDAETTQLISQRLIPAHFREKPYPVYLLLSANRRVIARINGDDHLQIEIWGDKGECYRAVQLLQAFDARLQKQLPLATDAEFGAVARNFSTLGSGIVIGEVLHTPALVLEGRQETLLAACHELGLAYKAYFPQHEPRSCGLYLLRTEFAMGDTLNRRCRAVARGASQLERQEKAARSALQNSPVLRPKLLDSLGRAAGTVKGARLMTAEEARFLLSMLWLGAELGVFRNFNWHVLFRDYARLPMMSQKEEEALPGNLKLQLSQVTARMLRHDFGHEEELE